MQKLERIACLYLTFLKTSGISFTKLRKQMPEAWEGDLDTARRKFERDKEQLRNLGLNLLCHIPGDILPDGSIASEYIYYTIDKVPKLPNLQLSSREYKQLANLVFNFLNDSNKNGQLNELELEALNNAATKVFYQSPALITTLKDPSDVKKDDSLNKITTQSENSVQQENTLSIIHQALQLKKQLQMTYINQSGILSERRIIPRGLVARQSRWCMVANCQKAKAIRFFYIDQIQDLELLSNDFQVDPGFKIKNYNLHPLSIHSHDKIKIKIKFHSEYEALLLDFLENLPSIYKRQQMENNILTFETNNQEGLFSWMMRYPKAILNIAPKSVYQCYIEWFENIKLNYKSENHDLK